MMSLGSSTFADRLRIAMNGQSVLGFAKQSGVPEGSLRQYLASSLPGIDKAELIASAAGVSLDWLIANRGPMGLGELPSQDARVPAAAGFDEGDDTRDFTLVPRVGVSASAGHGLVALAEEITETLAFKTEWLREMGLSPKYCGLLTCSGDSMEPTIPNGAIMLVDMTPGQSMRSGCLYIAVLDGDVLVKRLFRRIDGTVELLSDNPIYPKEIVAAGQIDRIDIPGRVVWFGRSI